VLEVRVAGSSQVLAGSPVVIAPNPALRRFLQRADAIRPTVQARLGRMMDHRAGAGGVSVVLRVGQTPPDRVRAMLHSLQRQWCSRWEALYIADGAAPGSLAEIQDAARSDARIRLLASQEGGLAAAMNTGLRAARFDQVLFLTSAASLEPDAVHHLLAASVRPALLYWDEAVTHTDRGGITDAVCRGAFSPDLFRARPDLGTGFCLPAATARDAGAWRDGPATATEFVTRVLARIPAVGHIPRILARLEITGATAPGDGRTAMPLLPAAPLEAAAGEVLIVIPTHNGVEMLRRCLDSIRATAGAVDHRIVVIDHRSDDPATRRYLARLRGRATVMRYDGPFNYAAMNNQAVRLHAGSAGFVLFLNNDTEALHPGWLARLRQVAARPGTGAVGTLLLYPDLRVQHAGVVLGVGGVAGHAFAFDAAYRDGERLPGPQGLLTALRDVSAVTAACMMMPITAFEAVGGFDERFQVGFNDTDLCLRLRKRGLRILYDGQTVLLHHESRTRRQTGQLLHHADTRRFRQRWKALLQAGDPFYSPHLSLIAADWELRQDFATPGPVRYVRPDGAPSRRLTNM
jgi:GT2 family glycosyltransferase